MVNLMTNLNVTGSLAEVGCSSIDSQTYKVYVEFEFPPESRLAIEALSHAFDGFQTMLVQLLNPYHKETIAPLHDMEEAVRQITNNQIGWKREVTAGKHFQSVKVSDMYNYVGLRESYFTLTS